MMNDWQNEKVNEIIDLIKNYELRNVAETEIVNLPEYFWTAPASSSGKYHPSYALGDGGLFRHTLAACKIAIDLFPIYDFSNIEQDRILVALLLHDGFKQGRDASGGHTMFEHPMLMHDYLVDKYVYGHPVNEFTHNIYMVADMIGRHMGQWIKSDYSSVVLQQPLSSAEKFVHLCDYLASRKDIEVKLDDDCT